MRAGERLLFFVKSTKTELFFCLHHFPPLFFSDLPLPDEERQPISSHTEERSDIIFLKCGGFLFF